MVDYCETSDLGRVLPGAALASVSPANKAWAIAAASAEMDGYFRARYSAPLETWSADVSLWCAKIAVYYLMTMRGYRPEAGSDELIRLGYDDAVRWLVRVSRQEVTPNVTIQNAAPAGGQAFTTSACPRFRR